MKYYVTNCLGSPCCGNNTVACNNDTRYQCAASKIYRGNMLTKWCFHKIIIVGAVAAATRNIWYAYMFDLKHSCTKYNNYFE